MIIAIRNALVDKYHIGIVEVNLVFHFLHLRGQRFVLICQSVIVFQCLIQLGLLPECQTVGRLRPLIPEAQSPCHTGFD